MIEMTKTKIVGEKTLNINGCLSHLNKVGVERLSLV